MCVDRFLDFFQRYVDEMKFAIGAGEDHFKLTLLAGRRSFGGASLTRTEHCQIGHKVIVWQFDGFDKRKTENVP